MIYLFNKCRNSKGFTLVELLTIIVILGIVASIAVPTVGKLIENARKDAHLANARIMIDAARLLSLYDSKIMPDKDHMTYIPLGYLLSTGFIESIDSNEFHQYAEYANVIYDTPTYNALIATHNWVNAQGTCVVIVNDGQIKYYVKLFLVPSNNVVLPYTYEGDLSRNLVTIY